MSGLHPHGAARVAAGFGLDPAELAPLPQTVRERLGRTDVDDVTLHLAWELARFADPASDREALLHLLALLALGEAAGGTRVALDGLGRRAAEQLAVDGEVAARVEALGRAPHALIGDPGARCPLIRDDGFLYTQRAHAMERRVALEIATRASATTGTDALPSEVTDTPVRLNERQCAAVASTLGARLSIIRGGPGTGKTAIVVAILRAFARRSDAPLSFALAAPTGKAADRMRASIERSLHLLTTPSAVDRRLLTELPTPRTIHRLLGYSPVERALRHDESNPLSAQLVVVDEASMIDLALFDHLLRALHPGACLVLLGDPDQLPPVSLGSVFRDLGAAPSLGATELTESHRMRPDRPDGVNILRVAQQINRGAVPTIERASAPPLPNAPDAIAEVDEPTLLSSLETLRGVHLHQADDDGLARFLTRYYVRVLRGPREVYEPLQDTFARRGPVLEPDPRISDVFARLARARLLAVTRSAARATGVEAINAFLHRRRLDEVGAPPDEALLAAGEPVLVVHNDYERELFNGDQGVVLWTAEPGGSPRLSVVFEKADRCVAHPLASVRVLLELGYATTVHKAQGSEHDDVVVVLPSVDHPGILTREVVYTAVTRARRSVLLIGSEAILRRAVARGVERSSGLAARIETARRGPAPSDAIDR